MIHAVSSILKNPNLKDYYKIIITRQEPEINNNKIYHQEVSGSLESVRWYYNEILKQLKQQNTK